ncbi:MAG TPA: response regulator [Phototrophicaceae bacterium]|nr:response regulator [Phototrophicaceae bacterium]
MSDQELLQAVQQLIQGEVASWTVLLVDDEPDNLFIAGKTLSFNGATVHTARNGVEGLALLGQITPSFILSDLSMPQMDGWEMLKQVRANPRTRSVPVIALTAHAMAGDRVRGLDAGFNGYIIKPFRPSTLIAELLHCFQEVLNPPPVR